MAFGGVFISYRREGGAALARTIYEALRKRGYEVFMDVEDLRSGPFNTALFRRIESATNVVVVLTRGSLVGCQNPDDWFRLEVGYALKLSKNVVPVMDPNFQWPTQPLPEDLKDLPTQHGLSAWFPLFDASMDKLTKLLVGKSQRARMVWKTIAFGGGVTAALVAGLVLWPHVGKLRVESGPGAARVQSGTEPRRQSVQTLSTSAAALAVAGIYFGQLSVRMGQSSVRVRTAVEQYLQKGGIADQSVRKVVASIDAASPAPPGDRLGIITGIVSDVAKLADRSDPVYGKDMFLFGLMFGMILTGINATVDMPSLTQDQAASVVAGMQKMRANPFYAAAQDLYPRLPVTPRMRQALDLAFTRDQWNIQTLQQSGRGAALFSFLLWRVADEGEASLESVRDVPDGECASRMATRLATEGFTVRFASLPSAIDRPLGAPLK